jgi:hypothetical protein
MTYEVSAPQKTSVSHLASSAHALLAGRRRATANGGGIDPTRAAHEAAPVGPVDPGASLPLDPDPAV